MSTFKRLFAGAVAAGVLAAVGATSQAALVFDVRATDVVSGQGFISYDGKTVYMVGVGAVISYSVYALVTGTGSGTEEFQSAQGGIATGGTGMQVNLTHTLASPFTGSSSNPGTPTDLGGDGDTDIGTTLTPTNTTSGIIVYRSGASTVGNATGVSEFLLGTGTATVTLPGSDTVLNFILATPTSFNKNPSWKEDGVTKGANTAGVSITVNPGVRFTVPEPGSLSLLGVGALGLLAQRRRQR